MKDDLLKTAHELSCNRSDGSQPSESSLRRSISTAYYAAFHFVLEQCADLLTGHRNGAELRRAWSQTYRGIDHRDVKEACNRATDGSYDFLDEIRRFASSFGGWMQDRHDADYNPLPDIPFSQPDAQAMIGTVEVAIEDFILVDEKHRRAFAIMVSCKRRK